MITQKHWRIAGAVTIGICAVMAYCGVKVEPVSEFIKGDLGWFTAYWGLFFVCFLAAIYFALLDIRYIRAQYAIEKREVFLQTLGDESFRKALRAGQNASKQEEPNQASDSSE